MPLFTPFEQRGVVLRNRIAVSPMCQYSATNGLPDDWHLVHLGSRAVGGAGAVISEATAVTPEGRISPADTGIWSEDQAQRWARIARFVHGHGSAFGIQLAHAGRKASTDAPWRGGRPLDADKGGWGVLAPSAVPFDDGYPCPTALDARGLNEVVDAFRDAAARALEAGVRIVEVHAAHGYLLHQFLSPLSNRRTDAYGGGFENRTRLLREVVEAVRRVWPERLPLWVRLSATDWAEGGWDADQSVELARMLKASGVDLVDVSSGGLLPHVRIPVEPGYQVPFAARIRRDTGIATGAVGLITEPQQAQRILEAGEADLVLLARASLRDPYFPYHAARALGVEPTPPPQYARAW